MRRYHGRCNHGRRTARAVEGWAVLGLAVLLGASVSHAQTPVADSSAWEPLGNAPMQIEGFAFSGDPDEPLIWADGFGLWTIQGVTGPWMEIDRLGPRNGSVYLYGPDIVSPDTIFAGEPFYRSTDGGDSFERVETPADLGGSRAIDGPGIDRAPPGSPYAHRFVASDGGGFLLSDDGGDTWVAADTTPPLLAFSVKALRSGRFLAAGFYGAVYSDDGGHTWHPIPELYDTTAVRFDVQGITILSGFVTGRPGDSVEGRVVLSGVQTGAGGGRYVWWSDDEGETWTRSAQPGDAGCIEDLYLLPLVGQTGRPGDVAAVTCTGVVLLSDDGAETWTEIGHVPGVSPETDTGVAAAALGPDGRIYVGTAKLGPTDSYSYRTRGRASGGFAVPVAGEEAPGGGGSVGLLVRPNPSRQRVTLELVGGVPERRLVVVVDGIGREVARTELVTGSSWLVDVSAWALGVYHARVGGGEMTVEPVSFTVVR